MPYAWTTPREAPERSGASSVPPPVLPVAELRLWPYRSLPVRGFVGFIAATAALSALPLVLVLGSAALWGLLPFLLLTLAGLWAALRHSYRTGEVVEELRLWPDRVELVRHDPRRAPRRWEANPHWVRAALHEEGGPVPHYLTLTGAGRTVEIGAFLSENERVALKGEIEAAFARLR